MFMDYDQLLSERKSITNTFPSERHELAWSIARYFDEPYREWLYKVENSTLWTGQILHAFNALKGDNYYTKKQQVKILMAKLSNRG